VQEVREQQGSVSKRLEVLDGRLKSEEAYLSSLHELQEAIVSQRGTVEDDIKERIEQLRRVANEREEYLIKKLRAVENDKLATIGRQREQCLTVLESMRSASSQVSAFDFLHLNIWKSKILILNSKILICNSKIGTHGSCRRGHGYMVGYGQKYRGGALTAKCYKGLSQRSSFLIRFHALQDEDKAWG